jgi:DNA-binding NarL/FixJ family response regulator
MTLTLKQMDVLQRLCKGLCLKEIAAELNTSTHNVSLHRRNICDKAKLYCPTNVQLFIWAIEQGLVEAPAKKV